MKLNKHIQPGNRFLILFIIGWLVVGACAAQKGNIAIEKVCNVKWVHSHEEDDGDIKVYRPDSYDFPPSRGRRGFKMLMKNYALTSYDIAPADGTLERTGNWNDLGENLISIVYPKEPGRNYKIEIISHSKKKLTFKISK